jgi:hypothetical protein
MKMIPPRARKLLNKTQIWVPYLVLVLGIVITSLWYLGPNPVAFPMDDTYIHFVYAKNLVEHGQLMFNSTGETGVGTTSLLWVLLLALCYKFGVGMSLAAKIWGITALIILGLGVYSLLRSALGPLQALVSALLVVLSGHLLWFSLSGMETTLFLALGVLALLAYRGKKWVWLGVLLGLIVLTRPEGLALSLAIGLIELLRSRRVHRGLLTMLLIAILIFGPWFGYLFLRTGHIIPTSGIGKHLSMMHGIHLVTSEIGFLSVLGRNPALIYPLLWVVYIVEFVLGGMALPSPHISVGAFLNRPEYKFSIWALIGLVCVIIPLIWSFIKAVAFPRKWKMWVEADDQRPMLAFAAWAIIHNVAYMVFLPTPGTASRYGAINHLVLWMALAIGLSRITCRTRHWPWLAIGLCVIALSNCVYWNGVYDANVDHMKGVRIVAAQYVGNGLLSCEKCAASDIGAMRYFSQRPLLDLCGLIDPDLGQVFLAGEMDRYLVENEVTCLILPGRVGVKADGWFDHAEVFGLSDSLLFDLDQIAEFTIDRDRWLQGYLPTQNYQATVTIYRLIR